MKKLHYIILFLAISIQAIAQPRTETNFNKDWKFTLGDQPNAQNASFSDSDWRKLNLPHDWSIEGDFKKEHPSTNAGGALPGGIGWYRKTFTLPESAKGKITTIKFDGVYKYSEVWINGKSVGKRPNGYISFQYDITQHLNYGSQPNTIAVRVDNSQQPDSRWYTGSGIYRNVTLITTQKVAVEPWETFTTTPQVSKVKATVNQKTGIRNSSGKTQQVKVVLSILDAKGKELSQSSITASINKGLQVVEQDIELANPIFWSVSNPHLYKIKTSVYIGEALTDETTKNLGVRTFNFDVAKGFTLNNEPLKILGVCLHHDLGAIGAAVNVRAMERQLEIMKAMGANAIRTAHNPPAPEFLDLCDKMGFLVMDEAYDMWKKRKNKFDYHLDFEEWSKRDLEDLVKRDRNHPSVFMWSIGNEIREQFDSTGTRIAAELSKTVKALDPTRPVTTALTETFPEKNFIWQSNAIDVLGFNYKVFDYDSLPGRFKNIPLLAAETTSALQTRGVYDLADTLRLWPASSKDKFVVNGNADHTVTAYDNVAAYWGVSHETAWKKVKDRNFLAGLFVWTGFDYIGEPVPYDFPARSSYYGVVDLAGFPKDVYYMYQSEWTDKPVLHLLPHWNWEAGKTVDVWAYYNNADEVELFLNGKSLGTKTKEGENLHAVWKVPFEAGTLKAVSKKNGKTVLTKEIKTAGAPYKLELIADRKQIKADGNDLSFITVNVLDKQGNIVPDADNLVKFTLEGNGTIAGTDNGYQADLNSLSKPERKAWKGKCLAIIKSTEKAGKLKLTARADGLPAVSVKLRSK